MDEGRSHTFYLAPGYAGSSRMKLPGNTQAGGQAWPPIDEHLVEPEVGRQEIVDGQLIEASPALAPHGDEHARLDLVIGAHVRPGWRASSDLLTRVDQTNNFATDTCVRREGVDPATGARYLEELAFEVKSTQSLGHLKRRARAMLRRGVRRFFVVCVKELDGPPNGSSVSSAASSDVKIGPVLEWIPEASTWPDGDWRMLGNQDVIDDPSLARPLEVTALLDAVSAEIAVGRALIAKENPAIVAYGDSRYHTGKTEGVIEGKRDALRTVLAMRDLALSAEHLGRIDACSDPDLLDRWLRVALAATRAADIFDA
jgi:hypothetical protein